MKNSIIITLLTISLSSCKQTVHLAQSPVTIGSVVYQGYGAKIDMQSVMSMGDLNKSYQTMSPLDTVYAKVEGKILEVCSKKGCWMTLEMGNGNEIMMRFKDYGFFMPLNADGTVIVSGKAFVSEISVDDLKHYAEDAGATEATIEAIINPEKTYSFEAVGALLAL
tara:strand:+ start:504 stop:1001 length:498 start_codon:yes stop_codon:yes gene_type:complete